MCPQWKSEAAISAMDSSVIGSTAWRESAVGDFSWLPQFLKSVSAACHEPIWYDLFLLLFGLLFYFLFLLESFAPGESLYGEVQLTALEELPQWISTGCFEYLIWRGFFVIYLSINHWLFIPLLWLALFLMNFIQTLKYGCHRSFSVPYRTSSCIHILSAEITGTWHYVQLNFNSMKIMISGKRDSRLI